ncbi:hypothetical protein AB5I41_17335 [Sphingomonas sp. MMS24-JH45]
MGADSFTYTASDGKASSTATVAVSVSAPAKLFPSLPDSRWCSARTPSTVRPRRRDAHRRRAA